MPRDPLPIDAALPELLARLREANAVVLRAPTGAGKTTRVPPAVADMTDGLVLMLEPRRVAARAAARRMAVEHGSPLGDVFGYHVRFDRKAGPRTRVLVVTPGVLLRMLHDDPYLERVGCVVFDEFHERGLESDLALGMVRLIRQTVRPELRAVVMSATLDVGPIAAYLGGCPAVTSEGRTFPVEVRYRPRRLDTPVHDAAAAAVRESLDALAGDVLVFLPGIREIRQTADRLAGIDAEVLPLHGDLPPEQQDRALQRLDRRKVVLATNVAETSVTVDGVTVVIDTGQARQLEFDAGVGMDRLRLVPISKASADQRAGRAGRTQPGVCVRLWDEIGHKSRPADTEPEVRRADLAPAVLALLALGETDAANFPWLEPPRPEALERAVKLLDQLGATASGALTPLGREMAALPVHPRLGRMLIEGKRLGVGDRAAAAAAVLSDRDPFQRTFDGPPHLAPPAVPTVSDVLDRVEALEAFAANGRTEFPFGRLNRGSAYQLCDARDQFVRLLGAKAHGPRSVGFDRDDALLRCVFVAYPDRLARRRTPNDRRGLTADGRGVRLAPQSGVIEPELFVCVDADAGGADSLVRLASGVRREWLPADKLVTRHEVEFDESAERIIARKRTRFDGLVIDDTQGHIGDEDEAARVLATAAVARLDRVLPPPDSAAGGFRTRVRCLRTWMPELELPAFDDSDLIDVLPDLCRGRRSLTDVRSGPWLDVLRNRFTYQQLRTIDDLAPERISVPSGSQITLAYEEGRPPVLAVRVQELFGLPDTPRVAGGRVKVTLHLLAPNYRPQQVTDDLASFWANTYPLVRKELRGRYPKHDWPENPLEATASRGPRKRN